MEKISIPSPIELAFLRCQNVQRNLTFLAQLGDPGNQLTINTYCVTTRPTSNICISVLWLTLSSLRYLGTKSLSRDNKITWTRKYWIKTDPFFEYISCYYFLATTLSHHQLWVVKRRVLKRSPLRKYRYRLHSLFIPQSLFLETYNYYVVQYFEMLLSLSHWT